MKLNRLLLISLGSSMIAAPVSPAFSQTACAGGEMAAVRSSPGGSQTGAVFPGGCVKVGEKRDIWVKVTLEGWVDEQELKMKAASASAPTTAAPAPAEDPVELAGFDLAVGNRDLQGNPSRVQLTLHVKNSGGQPISGWSGLLAAQDLSGKVLFRYRVSDDGVIAPGTVKDVSYYWDKTEEPYAALADATKDKIKVSLHKIELKR